MLVLDIPNRAPEDFRYIEIPMFHRSHLGLSAIREFSACLLPNNAIAPDTDQSSAVPELIVSAFPFEFWDKAWRLTLDLQDHGLAVDAAASGAEALARLEAGADYDVIVTDFAMPKMTGAAFLDEARRRVPDIPAIILTGDIGAVAARSLQRFSGARVTLIRKPVSGAALFAAIADLVPA